MKLASKRMWVTVALVGVAAVWGGTFVMVKDAVSRYPLYGFLGLRFMIAVLAFVVMFPTSFKLFKPGTVRVGVVAGLMLCAGYIFQTWGLQATSASKAAFITGMFVVITPALQALLLRKPPRTATIAGVVLAVGGLWLLSGGTAGGWNVGDTRTLLCAAAYSAHMIVLGGAGREHDARPLTLVQLVTVAVVCGGIALTIERPPLPPDGGVWVALVVTGVFASAVAFAVQTYAQRIISPTKTALILIMEPAFGGMFGWLAGETLGLSGVTGAALILCGMVVAEFIGVSAAVTEHVVIETTLEGPSVSMIEQDS
ncbi:MAG: DMT family transporter [Coriobacteriia bacterium]|nr:DMT family transporter [Coriobacteriia bacterium]